MDQWYQLLPFNGARPRPGGEILRSCPVLLNISTQNARQNMGDPVSLKGLIDHTFSGGKSSRQVSFRNTAALLSIS